MIINWGLIILSVFFSAERVDVRIFVWATLGASKYVARNQSHHNPGWRTVVVIVIVVVAELRCGVRGAGAAGDTLPAAW